METETTEQEFENNGSKTSVISIRCYPELKSKITEEATDLGIKISEYGENILQNYNNVLREKQEAVAEIQFLTDEVANLQSLVNDGSSELINEIQRLKNENSVLRQDVNKQNDQLLIFKNKRLLELFELVKNKDDTIETPGGGGYKIIYEQPIDLLEAMIYSFNDKNP